MESVTESLSALVARRQGELTAKSLRELYRRIPDGEGGRITYETFRNLANGTQRGTRDERVYRDVALALDVSQSEVRAAMGVEPTHGAFELPPRAQGLDPTERRVVLDMIEALLRAKRTPTTRAGEGNAPTQNPRAAGSAATDDELARRRQGAPRDFNRRDDQHITITVNGPDERALVEELIDKLAADHQEGLTGYQEKVAEQESTGNDAGDKGE